jgi:hypothetical protein
MEVTMTIFGITPQGLLFAGASLGLFGWGVAVGLKGAFAPAPPCRDGWHAPGAVGTHDPRCTHCAESRAA